MILTHKRLPILWLSPSFRILVGLGLLTRTPSLYNDVPNAGLDNFNENIPLRDEPLPERYSWELWWARSVDAEHAPAA